MAITQEQLKDRILIALLSCLVTSTGWFFLWAKDVPTLERLEGNPPILRSIPALREKIERISEVEDRLLDITTKLATHHQVQNQWIYELKEVQQTLNLLNDTIIDLKLSLAKTGKIHFHVPYDDILRGQAKVGNNG